MIAADTSVVVAAFASWHEEHGAADRALDGSVRLVAHCAVEAYSVLTRLPAPHRAAPALVRDFLRDRFPSPTLALDVDGPASLVARLCELGITGGAAYDALIAITAAAAGSALITCDQRAMTTYRLCNVEARWLSALQPPV